ncbi:12127_t:CDS:2, partial [Racocetra persica]
SYILPQHNLRRPLCGEMKCCAASSSLNKYELSSDKGTDSGDGSVIDVFLQFKVLYPNIIGLGR